MNDSPLVQNIVKLLPIEAPVCRWGGEVFFQIKPLQNVQTDQLTKEVNAGDVAFSPQDNCLCLFLGPTPASVLENPVAENPVAVIGRMTGPLEKLKEIKAGETIKVFPVPAFTPAPEKNAYASERKLSQTEIDALVKRLLEEKRSIQGRS